MERQELVPAPRPDLPDGLLYVAGFLSGDEEAEVRSLLGTLALAEFRMHGVVARRRVAHFGFDYAYDARSVAPGPPIPPFLLPLRERAAALAGVAPEALAEVLVTRYPPGAAIGWHRDAPMFGRVVGVSLGAPARLKLRRGGAGGPSRELVLAPGSAYVLSRAARWAWQHSIPAVKAERWSVTFRTMRSADDRRSRADASS